MTVKHGSEIFIEIRCFDLLHEVINKVYFVLFCLFCWVTKSALRSWKGCGGVSQMFVRQDWRFRKRSWFGFKYTLLQPWLCKLKSNTYRLCHYPQRQEIYSSGHLMYNQEIPAALRGCFFSVFCCCCHYFWAFGLCLDLLKKLTSCSSAHQTWFSSISIKI